MSPSDGSPLPSGTVTFLFMDIEGSTTLLERLQDDYPRLLRVYRELTEEIVGSHHGVVFGAEGDGLFAVTHVVQAVADLAEGQRFPGQAGIARVVLDQEDLDGFHVRESPPAARPGWAGRCTRNVVPRPGVESSVT